MSSNSELLSVLDSVSIQDLLSSIRKKAKFGNKDVVSYIRAIFQGSSDQTDISETRRFETFKCSISLLQFKDLPSTTASELLSLLLLKTDLLQTSNLMKLAELFVDHAKKSEKFENSWLEVFSKVLSCLIHRDSIVYKGKDMSGSELRQSIITSLFSDDSETSCLIQLSSLLKDLDLIEDEVNIIVERLLKILPTVDLVELPPFIYQLLLISSRGQCKRVLQSILNHFVEKDKQMQNLLYEDKDSEDMINNHQDHIKYRQTEGTAILMISVICRHDQNIGKEFLLLLRKMLHKPQLIFSPFIFSTALSLSKIHRNSDDIFDILKRSLVSAFQLKGKRQNSFWFRTIIQWEEEVLKLIKEAVKCSKFGWDHVCQGLVKFGIVVLDAFGPRCIAGNAVKTVCPEACDLGSHIIRDTFKSHRIVRQEIFEQILNRIITKSQKPVSHYIDILSQIVHNDPLFLLDVLPKLVEILDYLYFLPHSNAESILQSLAPLLKISAPLKDTLMLVLRKALFHRDIEARKVAVCGYLTILKKINFIGKVSLSQSQTSIGSHASSSSFISTQMKADVYISAGNPTAKTMCLEIMGLLKRVLMQHSEVKQLLYEGLYDVILQNASLKDIVLELLLSQFEKYYNTNEAEIPLHFCLCFQEQTNTIILKEPLAHLITSIYLILSENSEDATDEDYDQSAQKILDVFMQNLKKRMLVVDVSDFQISKDADLDESCMENRCKIHLLLNIYEALLEYSFMQNSEFELERCEEFLKLYRKYKQIFDLTKKKQNKSSKSKANIAFPLLSHTTINFGSKIMESLFLDETFKHQEGLRILRGNSDFVIHIVTACNQKLIKMYESGHYDGFSRVMKNSFNHITTIGKVLLKIYSDGLCSDFSSVDWEELSNFFADALNIIFNFVSLVHRKNMRKFICNICNDDCLSASEALQYIIKNIQKSIMKLLSDTDDDSNLKECIPLLSVIRTLYSLFTSEFKGDVYKWIKQLCSQQVFQNVGVSKAFLSLCFALGHQDENFLRFLKEMAFDIRYHLGNIDPDESISGTPKYEIISSDLAKNMLPIFFTNLEQTFEEIEWVLNFLKMSTLGGNGSFELTDIYCRLSMEQGMCSRVSDLILIFYELVQTGVSENNANSILKLVKRLYKIVTSLAKYYMLLHKNRSSELHPAFEKLVKLFNAKLTTQVYAFITFIQMLSGESGDKKKKAKGNTGAFKAVQDVKIIPALVFEIETFEKNLIILSKKYKRDLTNKMKLSTARDFRINAAVVTSVLEQQEIESVTDTTVDETNNDNVLTQPNRPQNVSVNNSPIKDDSDHISMNNDSSDEAIKSSSEPLNASLNIFGDVPINTTSKIPNKEKLNPKRKRLGIRRNKK